jgi:predicted Zn-dependent protease
MDSEVSQSRITLKDWESRLAPQVRQVELLGEIPITADECAQLGKAIDLRILANFKHAWHERDYRLIAKVAERLPASVLLEQIRTERAG